MEQPLVTLVALVLVAFCKGETSTDDFCLEKRCPEYTLVDKNKGFEERRYAATEWITTKVDGDQPGDLIAANTRLKDSGYKEHSDAWPVLLTQTEGKDGSQWFLSWFVPQGTPKPESPDPLVTLEVKHAATVYVRVFSGRPSHELGLKNVKILQDDLKEAGRPFNPSTYSGAAYEPFLSLYHHNEIWIYAE